MCFKIQLQALGFESERVPNVSKGYQFEI